MNILIGISWPFANGELHIGHAASSIGGDVIARYYRLKGDKVCLVSGSDCHGTPIDVKALKENKHQKEIVDICHSNFSKDWKDLGVSFDLYNRTDDIYHKDFVQNVFRKYYEKGFLYEKIEEQLYCEKCNLFLADRYVIGVCPKCGADVKGDECEKCGSLLAIEDVKDTKCAICESKTIRKETKNLYFSLSKFQNEIEKLCESNKKTWRENAYDFTKRYLKEGIPDRCASRSLNWGIDIPIKGYEDKKIYGWFENVWGYVTACKKHCESTGQSYEDYWKNNKNNRIYLVHAKDNIPFHTVIFPALLLATEENYKLPDYIVSDCHLTIEGEKLSKSKGNYISLRYMLDKYPADSIRYFFISNEAIKKDFNFSWNDFINSHNGELLGKWGNFVNRNLAFINKSFDSKLTNSKVDEEIEEKLINLYESVSSSIEAGNPKDGLNEIFEFINYSNKYFDENKPWILVKENIEKCNEILYNCCNIIYNINNLLKPYLPYTSDKIDKFLNLSNNEWKYKQIEKVEISKDLSTLYERYDKSIINEELEKLKFNN